MYAIISQFGISFCVNLSYNRSEMLGEYCEKKGDVANKKFK